MRGKALVLAREPLFVANHVHEVGRIGAVEHGEARIEPQLLREQPQDPVAHRVEGAGPQHPGDHASIPHLAAIREHLRHDGLGAANHFLGGAACKGEHQDARRIDAVQHQVSGAMGERIGLARPRSRQDEHRAGDDALLLAGSPERGCAPLLRVQGIECRRCLRLHHEKTIPSNCMDIQIRLRHIDLLFQGSRVFGRPREGADHSWRFQG